MSSSYIESFAIISVIIANKIASMTVKRASSASIPRALPEKTASEPPSMPPIPPDFASCPKITAISAIEIIASKTIKTVCNLQTSVYSCDM